MASNSEPFLKVQDLNHLEQLDSEGSFMIRQCGLVFERFGPMKEFALSLYRAKKMNTSIAVCVTEYLSGNGVILQEVAIYCHHKDVNLLENYLSRTGILDFDKFIIYLGNNSHITKTLENVSKMKKGQLLDWSTFFVLALPPEKPFDLVLSAPDNVYYRSLTTEEAWVPYKSWKYRATLSYDAFQAQVNILSLGVFLKSNDQLISWIILSKWGAMSFMYTVKEYRRQGYGTLAVKAMSTEVAKRGLTPFACIENYNQESLNCFAAIGFKKISHGRLMYHVPDSLPDMKKLDCFFSPEENS